MTADMDSLLAQRQWVKDLALRLVGDHHAADDLSQETYLRALRSPSRPQEIRSERAWLGTLLRNLISERFRSDKRRRAREATLEPASTVPSTEEVVARASVHRHVVETVMDLSPKYREVILLRYFEGHSPSEIAAARKEPVSSIKTRLQRGLEQMRGQLDAEDGGDGRSWMAALAPVLCPLPASSTSLGSTATIGARTLIFIAAALTASLVLGWLAFRETRTPPTLSASRLGASPAQLESADKDPSRSRKDVARSLELMELRSDAALNLPEIVEPLAGTVVDIEGPPVAGVVVAVRPPPWLDSVATGTDIAISDTKGAFAFRGTVSGLIEVLGENKIALLLGDAYATPRPLTRGRTQYTIVVSESMLVEGRVIAKASGLPLPEAVISWLEPTDLRARIGHDLDRSTSRQFATETDEVGRFKLRIPEGIPGALLRLTREGFEVLELRPLTQITEYSLARTQYKSALTGRVTDSFDRPLTDIRVSDGVIVTRTDRNGEFSLPEDQSRKFVVAARPGMLPARLDRELGWPDSVHLRLTQPAFSQSGLVCDQDDNPMPGARVWIDNPSRLRRRSAAKANTRIEVRNFGLCQEEVREPSDGAILENYLAGDTESQFSPEKTNELGHFEIHGLADRDYIIAAVAASGGPITRTRVSASEHGAALKITVHPDRVHVVRGIVRAARTGEPLAHIVVRWERLLFQADGVTGQLDGGPTIRTGSSGRFELIDVPDEAEVRVRISGPGIQSRSFPIDNSPLDLRIPRRIRMRVRSTTTTGLVAFSARGENGRDLRIQTTEGNRLVTHRSIKLTAGRSAWTSLPETAVEIVGLDSLGKVILRRPVAPIFGTSLEIDL